MYKKSKENKIKNMIKMFSASSFGKFLSEENLTKKVGKNGSNLSGGQRQIVSLIRAIMQSKPVIIMDEPTASLDQKTIKYFQRLFNVLKEMDNIIIVVTHDNSIKNFFTRIIYMQNGQIISN